jgi:ribosomal protein L44E
VSRLQGLARRYVIEEDWREPHKYCRTCRDQAESKLAAAHAAIRAAHAEFNSRQERELAAIDHGGLDQLLRSEFEDTLRRLNLTISTEQPKQFEAAQPATTHVMQVASTGGE